MTQFEKYRDTVFIEGPPELVRHSSYVQYGWSHSGVSVSDF